MSVTMIDSFKDLGNREFRRQNYKQAIQLYTQALDSVNDTIPIETQRMLLANRSQAFILYGVILEALRDVDHALSPQYTSQVSPKPLTAKCRCRRAKLLCTMARYEEAQAEYSAFASIMEEIREEISGGELEFKSELDSRAAADDDSDDRRRDELMRAIDARGIILQQSNRATFPLPPPEMEGCHGSDFCPESMTICFDTFDCKPDRNLPDPNQTPISIPVSVLAPYYFPNPNSQVPFSGHEETPVSENETIGSFVQGMFTSIAIYGRNQESLLSAMAHERDGVLVMMTSRGRLLKIPRETTIKEVVAGARWPRQANAPVFEDLRRIPRKRNDEIDGIELAMGWEIQIYVVTNDKIRAFVDRLERAYAKLGI